MKKLRLKNNNIGMTLVELLVAIAIFAAAIIPMLYAFVYSTGFNFKAQQTMQSTGIAQAIIEKCKAANTDYDQLVLDLTSGDILKANNNFSIGSVSVSGNTYTFNNVKPKTYEGNAVADAVDNGNADRRSYDVQITVSPLGNAITDYSALHPMRSGTAKTANFTDAGVNVLRTKDETFQAGFKDLIQETIRDNVVITPAPPMGTDTDTYADYLFTNKFNIQDLQLKRVITITALNDEVKLNVNYEYVSYEGNSALNLQITTSSIDGTNRTIKCNATPATNLDSVAYPAYETKILDGSPASSVFFYYYPLYAASVGGDGTSGTNDDTAGFTDSFVLNNDMTADYLGNADNTGRLDFYLFKQLPSSTDTFYDIDDVEDLDDDYKAEIEVNSSAPFRTNLYHNLLWNVVTGDELPAASHPSVSLDHIHECYNRTAVVHVDPDNLSDRTPGNPPASQNYKDTFIMPGSTLDGAPAGYEHDSLILEDKAVIPYGSEKYSGGPTGKFGARFQITVSVFPHGSTDCIETMTSEFLNW